MRQCWHESDRRAGQASWPTAIYFSIGQRNQELAASTNLSIREIHIKIGKKVSRGRVGEIAKQIQSGER